MDGIEHIVINSLAKKELSARKGIQAQVFPNVFDFNHPSWQVDALTGIFESRSVLKTNDVLILQATRIVPRKGIELAIDFVKALNHPERRRKLGLSGLFDGRKFTRTTELSWFWLVIPKTIAPVATWKNLNKSRRKWN